MNKRLLVSFPLLALALLPACGGDDGPSDDDVGDTGTDSESGDSSDSSESESAEVDSTDEPTTDTADEPTTDTADDPTMDSADDLTTDTTDDTTTDTTDDTTETTGDGVCGNGLIEAGEECDDGNNSDQDGCLASCLNATCGDGFINMGVEACDDGINDGSYGGCAADCASLGPHCGDGAVNGDETCDDGNDVATDGCLDICSIPASCLEIIDFDDMLESGDYLIKPAGYAGDAFEVYCDMVSDGGGYTFLKVDPGAQYNAQQAEGECAEWGMQLWIPRSSEHKTAGWEIANDPGIGPDASADYMRILGIYPNFNGATCANQAMNSNNPSCQWDASDDGPWFVHDVNNISEPNGDNSTVGSMYYEWQGSGQIQWHNDIGGAGYTSARFMCDVGDKLP